MAIGVDQIFLSMTSPETGEYLMGNVYTVDGVYEADGVTARRLSIGQLVMAICLKRAAELEANVISKMNTLEDVSEQLQLMTEIETEVLNDTVNMSTKKVRYNGTEYAYCNFLVDIMDMDGVPSGEVNAESTDFLTSLEAKMDEKNSFSQKTMIELQSTTNKRDQTYDMISTVLKAVNSVLIGNVNNM